MDDLAPDQFSSLQNICVRVENAEDLFRSEPENTNLDVYESEQFVCSDPINLAGHDHADLFTGSPVIHRYDLIHGAGPVGLASLSHILLATPHGFMFSPDGSPYAESYHNDEMAGIPYKEVRELAERLLADGGSYRRTEEPAILLMGPWSWNYHHWLLEDLPRLWVLDEFSQLTDCPLIVPGDMSSFQMDSLKALGIDQNRLRYFDGSAWRFDRLYAPTFLAPGGHSRRQIDWLREKLFSGFGLTPSEQGDKRLYLTRRDAPSKRVVNEAEIEKTLSDFGFETIDPGKMTLRQQVETFSRAKFVVAAHGATLTNLAFAPPSAGVIEFLPASFVNRANWYLANVQNQSYAFLIGEPVSEWQDYGIDAGALAALLNNFGLS